MTFINNFSKLQSETTTTDASVLYVLAARSAAIAKKLGVKDDGDTKEARLEKAAEAKGKASYKRTTSASSPDIYSHFKFSEFSAEVAQELLRIAIEDTSKMGKLYSVAWYKGENEYEVGDITLKPIGNSIRYHFNVSTRWEVDGLEIPINTTFYSPNGGSADSIRVRRKGISLVNDTAVKDESILKELATANEWYKENPTECCEKLSVSIYINNTGVSKEILNNMLTHTGNALKATYESIKDKLSFEMRADLITGAFRNSIGSGFQSNTRSTHSDEVAAVNRKRLADLRGTKIESIEAQLSKATELISKLKEANTSVATVAIGTAKTENKEGTTDPNESLDMSMDSLDLF